MILIDFINRLLGRPLLLNNGYPDMAANHRNPNDVVMEVGRRINGGGYYIPPPPPPIPIHQPPVEKPEPPMVAEVIDKIVHKPVRVTPSGTSTLSDENLYTWCGATLHCSSETIENEIIEEKDNPLVLNHLPLKNFLIKRYKWIMDVTEVRVRPRSASSRMSISKGDIVHGPLEIHITVSPIHYSELMLPKIEKKIRENLYQDLIPLITCMFEHNNKDKPIIIFSPSYSETILEYVK